MKIVWTIFVFSLGITLGLFFHQYNTVYLTRLPTQLFHIQMDLKSEITFNQIMLEDQMRIFCIALAIYGEGRGETTEGMASIGFVVKNRVRDARFASDACLVILQAGQFEPFFPSKPLYHHAVNASKGTPQSLPHMDNAWKRTHIMDIAEDVYYNWIPDPTQGATHFWSPSVQHKLGRAIPDWTNRLVYKGIFGTQKYYD